MKTLPLLCLSIVAFSFGASYAEPLPDQPVVKGTFIGDGKEGNIKYLVVQTRDPFSDKAAIRLIFTEKNPAASKKPDFDAGFKKLGNALILSVFQDGGIFGCEVAHSAHSKSPFSAVGKIKMTEFKVTETHVAGHVSTGGELEAFGQKWTAELTFSAPLPKGAFAMAKAEEKMPGRSAKAEEEPVVAGPKLPVAELPLPASARNVEYKGIVQQIAFQSDSSVSSVAGEMTKTLKQKGWKDAGGNLVTKASAILRRKLNGAEVTIMIKAAGPGCTANITTQGLDWANPPASTASASPVDKESGPKGTDGGAIEDEANRLIKDALKKIQLPKGF